MLNGCLYCLHDTTLAPAIVLLETAGSTVYEKADARLGANMIAVGHYVHEKLIRSLSPRSHKVAHYSRPPRCVSVLKDKKHLKCSGILDLHELKDDVENPLQKVRVVSECDHIVLPECPGTAE